MALKDYYNILQVLPTATSNEIKKAYRKLALQYHPDTSNHTNISSSAFLDIKEAYEILSDTKKRQAYHYKRFYKNYQKQVTITPNIVLHQSIDLVAFVAISDPHRIDYDKLTHQIMQILDVHIIKILISDKDPTIREKIINNILKSTSLLTYKMALSVHNILLQLASDNPIAKIAIQKQTQHLKYLYHWHTYKLPVALLITIILCIFFYYIT